MMNLKNKLRMGVVAVIIVAALFWAYDTTRASSYTGNGKLSFEIGGGVTTIVNNSNEPAQAHMTQHSSFTVASRSLDMTARSTREGSGSSAVNIVDFALPAGTTDIHLTRGSDVTVIIDGSDRFEVTVKPTSLGTARTTWLVAIVVSLGALYYISRLTGRQWGTWARQKLPAGWPGHIERTPA